MLVINDVVNVMAAYQPVLKRAVHVSGRNWIDIDHFINDEHNRTIIVVLAKHEIAPWWWFLREPKHVGAIVGILIVLTFLWFYKCVHQLE